MHHTRDIDSLAAALIDLMSFFASPRRDEALLREAGVDLDRALFPLLVRLASAGPSSVAALAGQVGRDHSTVSRQLSKLEGLGLIARPGGGDRRVRLAGLTAAGGEVVQAIAGARRRLLSKALAGWSETDRASLANLNRRFVDALAAAVRAEG